MEQEKLCACGSGKKYKDCCLAKFNTLIANPKMAITPYLLYLPKMELIRDSFLYVLKFIKDEAWEGACYSTAAIFYIIFSEFGLNPIPCIGEVFNKKYNAIFDHGWIELDGKVYDAAVSLGLDGIIVSGAVVNDIDLTTLEKAESKYGVVAHGLNHISREILSQTLIEYLDGSIKNGGFNLWYFIEEIADEISLEINISKIKRKYKNVRWEYVKR